MGRSSIRQMTNHPSRESLQFLRVRLVPSLWDSQTSNEIVGPTRVAVLGSRHIDRRTRRRLNLVWRAPDPIPIVGDVSQGPFVEANREVPERVGVEVQSHVVEALEDDLDQETPTVRPEFLSGTDFRFLSRQW